MRAALYARFSTDDQSPVSCEDQLALSRADAAKHGDVVVFEDFDDGISGFSTGNRPGMQRLLAFARSGGCDVVIAEHSDRLSRGLSGSGAVYEDLKSFGVVYRTVNQGVVTLATAGLSGLVSAMTLEEGANKTRRGLRARVERGRSAGGLTYGYHKRLAYDASGEPVRGLLDVDEAEKDVVLRIFRDYAAGVSPQAIAHALNREGVPSPRGGGWNASTIHGNAARGTGILHNELYAGVRVWGRRTFVKDRVSGARRGLMATSAPTRQDIPELRLVPAELWDQVRARYALVSTGPMGEGVRGRKRPKRFLQGLIICGECGGTMQMAGPHLALRCITRIEKGVCSNSRTPGYPKVEARVIAALQDHLLHPDLLAHAVRTIQDGLREARRDDGRQRAKLAAELADVTLRQQRLVDQVEQGAPWSALAERHATLEARRAALAQQIAAAPIAEVIEMPSAAAGKFRRELAGLSAALDNPDDLEGREARETLRALIGEVRFTPAEGRGQFELALHGGLDPLLQLGPKTQKGPLAGAFDAANVMAELGAGTRVTRRHNFLAPFVIAA